MEVKSVKQGKIYCATIATAPCTITCNGINDAILTLVDASEPGQYYFCAPTWSVTCQQDDVILVAASGGAGVGGAGGGKLSFELVNSFEDLPEPGSTNKIYLVPSDDPDTTNTYIEYVYIDGKYETLGAQEFDETVLEDYAKLSANNTFTGVNTFNNNVNVAGTITVTEGGLTTTGGGAFIVTVQNGSINIIDNIWYNNASSSSISVVPATWTSTVKTCYLKTTIPTTLSNVIWEGSQPAMTSGMTYVIKLTQINATAVIAKLEYTITGTL